MSEIGRCELETSFSEKCLVQNSKPWSAEIPTDASRSLPPKRPLPSSFAALSVSSFAIAITLHSIPPIDYHGFLFPSDMPILATERYSAT
jgi:hypothetical protein